MSILDLFITKAYALDIPDGKIVPTGSIDTSQALSLASIWTNVQNIIFFIAGAAAVIYLIWNGIAYITSGGDTDKAKKAKAGVINAIIGIIVIVATYAIISFAASIGNSLKDITTGTAA